MKWIIIILIISICLTFVVTAGYYSIITCKELSVTDIKFLNEVNKRLPQPNLTEADKYLLSKVREYEIKKCLT